MKTYLVTAAICLFALPAYADDTGFYSGTTLGRTSVGDPTAFPLTKSNDFVLGGFIGYKLNDNFGIEGEYTGLGRFKNATQSGKSDALGLSVVGYLPINDKFELYGKAGVAHSIGKSANGGLSNANRNAPTYGIGVQYTMGESTALRLGVDRFSAAVKDATTTRNYNSNVVGVTFIYKFH